MKRFSLNVITCVPAIWGYLLVAIFIYLLRCDAYRDGIIVVVHAPKIKWWNFSTTVSHAIFLRPSADANELPHELVHVRRYQTNAVTAFILGFVALPTNPALSLLLWLSSPTWPLFGYVAAWLRGEDPYWDADDEREARAVSAQRVSQLP